MYELIVAAEGPRQPETYYFVDRKTHEATKIAETYPGLKEADLGDMKPWPYKARDPALMLHRLLFGCGWECVLPHFAFAGEIRSNSRR